MNTASHRTTSSADARIGGSVSAFRQGVLDNLKYVQGTLRELATRNDYYMAVAYAVRDRLLDRWLRSADRFLEQRRRTVCYLSAEFLPGPHLGNNLLALGIFNVAREALDELGLDLGDVLAQEEEPGLGNGGLGRLAACYLDSLATMGVSAIGYSIRYEFGIFDQQIRDGWQVEATDKWLQLGNPWEIARPEIAFEVQFGGRTEAFRDASGRYRVRWIPDQVVKGVAYDTPVLGHDVDTANLLRLWKAEACESFDFRAFNLGDYHAAVEAKVDSENVTKVLYPNDTPLSGKELRLKQQYFFVSCSLRDMIRIYMTRMKGLADFHRIFAVQLNDTHPSLAIAELMRILVDEHDFDWEPAWEITRNTFGYTNHTLLPEALEKWPVDLFGRLLPRHLEIVLELNHRFLREVHERDPGNEARVERLSLIDETGDRYVRMAHLACVGSHAINGVARLHTELMKNRVFSDFFALWPERFSNKTNGVTQRRFLLLSNPRLSRLITSAIGEGWIKDLDRLRALEQFVDDSEFREEWRRIKTGNKRGLAEAAQDSVGAIDPESMLDVQAKRVHEYKRQHLNVLHVITRYLRVKNHRTRDWTPRTVLFAGKAAPGYFMAGLIIKLIHSVAEVVNADPDTSDHLRIVFLPNYSVSRSQRLFPAADLSEQISTAGTEASGTGNMKLAMNGAVTIGTLDGANIEIREEVGSGNFFHFGLTADQIEDRKRDGYRPRDIYDANRELREVIDLIGSGYFSHGDPGLFRPLIDSLLDRDEYMALADFASYVECQEDVDRAFASVETWTRMSILNVARIGKFSSDRAVREYCREIWNIPA